MHLVDGFDKRLSTPESDYLILDWHWEGEALVADLDRTHELIVFEAGIAHSFFLMHTESTRHIRCQLHWPVPVYKGSKVVATDIRVEGDLVWLIEEYLPLKGR